MAEREPANLADGRGPSPDLVPAGCPRVPEGRSVRRRVMRCHHAYASFNVGTAYRAHCAIRKQGQPSGVERIVY